MSQRDRDRLAVLRQVRDGLVTARRGAELVGLTPRHFRRLRRRWEAKGDRAVIHGLRGQRSNRALPTELRERVMVRVREPVFSDFAPTLLAEHPSTDPRDWGAERLYAASMDDRGRVMEAPRTWKRHVGASGSDGQGLILVGPTRPHREFGPPEPRPKLMLGCGFGRNHQGGGQNE